MRFTTFVALLLAVGLAGPAAAVEPASIAVFDFQLIDTSPAPPTPEEIDRAMRLGDALRTALANTGQYRIVDIAPVRAEVKAGPELRNCNGCERDYAKKLHAHLAAVGWVQKVSNLILNINLVIEDADTGRELKHGSVDIRGNTDESWMRGLKFLLDDQILDTP